MLNGIKTKDKWDNIVWEHPKTGNHHHLDGPAVIDNDNRYRFYCINNKLHNINGPAIIRKNSDKEYFINNKCYYSKHINQKHKWLLISLKRKLIQGKKY